MKPTNPAILTCAIAAFVVPACLVGDIPQADIAGFLTDSQEGLEEGIVIETDEPGAKASRGLCLTVFRPQAVVNSFTYGQGVYIDIFRFVGYSDPAGTGVCQQACQTWPQSAVDAGFISARVSVSRPVSNTDIAEIPLPVQDLPAGRRGWDCIIQTQRYATPETVIRTTY